MKQMEYTLKIITNGTVDTTELQDTVAALKEFAIDSVQVTNFKIVTKAKS